MKIFTCLFLSIVAAMLLAGCGDSSKKTAQAVGAVSNVVDAPLNYVGAVVQAKKYSENVIDVSYVNQDIQMFNASEGHYPKDLQEMVPEYLAKIPVVPLGYQLVYDTNTWTVKTVKLPASTATNAP
jgi:ABC-type glycerol-3-phosphate transport system substrate-binding protein